MPKYGDVREASNSEGVSVPELTWNGQRWVLTSQFLEEDKKNKRQQQIDMMSPEARAEYDKLLLEKERQAMAEQAAQKELNKWKEEGPGIKYNPIQDIDGKISLRDEFKDKGAADYIARERERLALQDASQLNDFGLSQAQNLAQSRASLASRGGLRGQNAAMLARFNMRDAMLGRQNLGMNSAKQRAELESRGAQLNREADIRNLETLQKAGYYTNAFELDKWRQQKNVEASKNQADATRQAGSGGKK